MTVESTDSVPLPLSHLTAKPSRIICSQDIYTLSGRDGRTGQRGKGAVAPLSLCQLSEFCEMVETDKHFSNVFQVDKDGCLYDC